MLGTKIHFYQRDGSAKIALHLYLSNSTTCEGLLRNIQADLVVRVIVSNYLYLCICK